MISGSEFQAFRKDRGFRSAQQLADASGVTREILAQFEAGRRASLSVEQVVALCAALKASPYDLVPEFRDADPALQFLRAEVRREIVRQLAEPDESVE